MNAPQARDDDEAIVAAAATPALAKVGGGIALLAGVIIALTQVQTLTMVVIPGAMGAAPYVLLVAGVATAASGLALMRARGWAATAVTALGGALFLLTGAWLVFSVVNGLISLFALGDPLLAAAALGLGAASIGPCARATAARKKLEERGLELGF